MEDPKELPALQYSDPSVAWSGIIRYDYLGNKWAMSNDDVWVKKEDFFKFLAGFEQHTINRVKEEIAHKLEVESENLIGNTEAGGLRRQFLVEVANEIKDGS